MCITFFESDVFILPLIMLCRSLVHTVNIGERSRLCFSNVLLLGLAHFASEIGPTIDGLDFVWGLCLSCFFLWSSPPSINVILKVPKFFNLILKRDTLLHSVIDVLMVLTVLVLVPFGAVSAQRVWPFEYVSLFCCHEDIFS